MAGLLIGITVGGERGNRNERRRGERGPMTKRKNVLDIQTENAVGITIDVDLFRLTDVVRGETVGDNLEVLNGILATSTTVRSLEVVGDVHLRAMMVIREFVLVEETMMRTIADALPEDIHVPLSLQDHGHPKTTTPAESESAVLLLQVAQLLMMIGMERGS
jgi:hypothetical protein